jgi:CBS domain-containing protein
MIIEDAIEFLGNIAPFQSLDERTLASVAENLSIDFFPIGRVILKQYDPPSDSLRIIKKGAVKVLMESEDGEDIVMDVKGVGDNFGFLSMVGKERQRTTVIAVEDTICYTLGRDRVMRLVEEKPVFSEYFMSYLSRYIDRTYKEMQDKNLLATRTDRLLFTTRAGDIAKDVITVSEETTIREAAAVMDREKISSLIVMDGRNLPAGIITDKDLRARVVAKGRNVAEPVKNIMSISLIRVDAGESCFEALLKMIKYSVHHMMVIREGDLLGVISTHDLMLLQGASPISLMNDIENQQSVEGLSGVSEKTNNLIGLMLKEGTKASNVTRVITEINDKLVKKVLALIENRLGPPPVPYCWMVFGSEGRREQTFKTDQDNALIHADAESQDDAERARRYFDEFTRLANEGLVQVGFPECTAGYMASNAAWRQPLSVWKRYFSEWISSPTPEAVLKSLIFFDSRPLHGKFALFNGLMEHVAALLKGSPGFFRFMAELILRNTPPVGFFKGFVVEKSGEHKDEFDLKVKGVTPLVDIVRLLALEGAVRETSTLGRVAALRGGHSIVGRDAIELKQAFEFIMYVRLQHQFGQIRYGTNADNFINPENLSNLEKKTLKESFHLIGRMQGTLREIYGMLPG